MSQTNVHSDQSRTYFGWQAEKVNFLFGLTGRRAAMVGAAALLVVWPLVMSALSAAVVCWPLAGLLAAAALVRIHGRTADEWATAYASYKVGSWRNLHKFVSGPFRPFRRDDADWGSTPDLPGVLKPLEFFEAPYGESSIAMAHHRIDGTYTAVARIRYSGIGLTDSHRRDRRVDGWGALMASLCTQGNPFVRMQVLQRLVPESGAALRRWHADHVHPDAPAAAVEVTAGLLATATLTTSRRDTFLAFTLDSRRAVSAIKSAGGGSAGAGVVMARQVRALSPQIASADLHVEEWLAPRDLAEVIKTAFDPDAARHLAERRALAANPHNTYKGLAAGVAPCAAGPMMTHARPGIYDHDGAHSVTYWVEHWPGSQVHPTVLAPLLGEGIHRRAFSIHIEPLAPRVAERAVMRERTSRSVAVRMRQRTGQVVPEHEKAALARAEAQDAERAAGHGVIRYTAYATITVTDPTQLEDACAALEADAAAARIEMRRMWTAQDIGFACAALPLGFGIPKKRW